MLKLIERLINRVVNRRQAAKNAYSRASLEGLFPRKRRWSKGHPSQNYSKTVGQTR